MQWTSPGAIQYLGLLQEDLDLICSLAKENGENPTEYLVDKIIHQHLNDVRDQLRYAELNDQQASIEMATDNKVERMINPLEVW